MTDGPAPLPVTPPPEGDGRPSAGGVLRNSASIVAAQTLGNVFRTIATFLLIACMRREDYGAMTLAIAFVDPIRSLAVLGIDAVAIRRAVADPASLPVVAGTLLRIRIVLAAVAFAVACGAGWAFRSDAPGGAVAVVCAAIGMLPSAACGPLEAVFHARQRMKRLVFVPAAANVAVVVTVVVLWLVRAPFVLFIASQAVGDLVSAVLTWRLARRELPSIAGPDSALRCDWALGRAMLREGLPLAYVNVVVVLYGRVGFLLLEGPGGEGAAADLGAASKLVNPILLLGAALSASVAPYASRLAAQGALGEFRAFFRKFLVRVFLWLGPVVAVAVLAAPAAVRVLKPEYAEAATAFRWLGFGALAMIVCQVSTSCLVGLGQFRAIAVFATLNLVVFLALAVPLTPRLGAEGVAIATFAMEAMNAVLQATFVLRLLRGRP